MGNGIGNNDSRLFFTLTSTGREIDFSDIDTNDDKKLSATEIANFRIYLDGNEKTEFDSIMRTLDTDLDKYVSKEEFEDYQKKEEEKGKIEEHYNELVNDIINSGISRDLQEKYITDLRNIKTTLINLYTGDINEMAESINSDLDTTYNTLLANAQADGNALVVDEVVTEVLYNYINGQGGDITDSEIKKMAAILKGIAEDYVDEHPYCTTEELKTELEILFDSLLNNKFKEELDASFKKWDTYKGKFKNEPSYEEFKKLKDAALALIGDCKKQGIKFSPTNIESTINNWDATDADGLINLMDSIIAQIKKAPDTLGDVFARGYSALVINISGTKVTINVMEVTDDKAKEITDMVMDEIMGGVDWLDDHDDWRLSLSDMLRDEAEKFYKDGNFTDADDFRTNLMEYLNALLENPLAHLQEMAGSPSRGDNSTWYGQLDNINISDPTEQDLKDLKNLLLEIWEAATSVIDFVDASGNTLSIKKLLDGYTRSNIGELKELINSLLAEIAESQLTMKGVYEANGNCKIKIILNGAEAVSQDETLLWNDTNVQDTVEKLIDTYMEKVTIDSKYYSKLYDSMKAIALDFFNEFIKNCGRDIGDFATELDAKFNTFVSDPIKALLEDIDSDWSKIKDNGDSFKACTDEEFEQLKDIFNSIITKANVYNIVLADHEGNAITASSILGKYNKNNAYELWTLLNNIVSRLSNRPRTRKITLNNLYENEKGYKLYISGTTVLDSDSLESMEDPGIPNDGGIPWGTTRYRHMADAKDRIKRHMYDRIREKAKALFDAHAIPESMWTSWFDTTFTANLTKAVEENAKTGFWRAGVWAIEFEKAAKNLNTYMINDVNSKLKEFLSNR